MELLNKRGPPVVIKALELHLTFVNMPCGMVRIDTTASRLCTELQRSGYLPPIKVQTLYVRHLRSDQSFSGGAIGPLSKGLGCQLKLDQGNGAP